MYGKRSQRLTANQPTMVKKITNYSAPQAVLNNFLSKSL